MDISFDQSVVCPVLIGRTTFLASFERVCEQVRSGQGQTLLVSGEAGIGKSRLAAEVRARIGPERMHFLQGVCFEQDRALPFAPLLDLLRSLLVSASRDAFRQQLAPFAPALLNLLPELAIFLPGITPAPALAPAQEQRRLFAALASFLLAQAEQHPVVLVMEDLHWSDDASLEFLLYLARSLGSRPLLLLLTYRREEVHPALRHFLSVLGRDRSAVEYSLTPLSMDEVHTMLRVIFQMKRPVRRDFLEALYLLTEGNPFFVEEVLKSLLAAGDIYFTQGIWDRKPLAELHIPQSISDAVEQRMSRLSAAARQTLELAAVVGMHFEFSLLQALTRRQESELVPLLHTLIAAQLIVESTASHFAFRHALTRQAVYQGLLARTRQALHLTVAQAMEDLYASCLDTHLTELASHWYQAHAWPEALDYAQRAGERAVALHSPRAALEHFSHALEAAHHLPTVDQVPLSRACGQIAEWLGDFEAARYAYEQVLEGARAAGDRQMEWQSLIDLGNLWDERDFTPAGDYYRRALDLAHTLDDPGNYALSQKHLAEWLAFMGEPSSAIAMLEESLYAFEQQGHRLMVAQVLQSLGLAALYAGERRRSLSALDRALTLVGASDEHWVGVVCLALRALLASPAFTETVRCLPGELSRCQQDLQEALRVATAIEWRAGQALAHYLAGWTCASFGALGAALTHTRTALEMATEIEQRHYLVASYNSAGDVLLALLDPVQASATLEAGLEIARAFGAAVYLGNMTASLAQAHLLAGDLARAEAALARCLSPEQSPRNLQERRLLWTWGELALAQQQPERALRLADELLASVPGGASTTEGEEQPIPALLKLRGEALFALGRAEEAIPALEQAQRTAQEQGALPLLWQIQRSLGRVSAASMQKPLAREAFSAAREVIARLAASLDDPTQRERFMQAALATLPKERPLTARQSAGQAFDGLSEREREIARLIAQGKSNREIAAALCISQRTVGTHIGHMYDKLGITSRAQLVTWAMEKGLVAEQAR